MNRTCMNQPVNRPPMYMRQEHSMNKSQLMCHINEVSFAVYEALLYLDTHPDDPEAIQYFTEYNKKREEALKEYAKRFGPLTIASIDQCNETVWKWAMQPWPWEGGDC